MEQSKIIDTLETYQLHLVVDYYMVYLVEDYLFRPIKLFNTLLILSMIIICE